MISSFYQRYSSAIIIAMFATLAIFHPLAESIPPNNDTETWLSDGNEARTVYEDFRHHFGGEELILIVLERDRYTDQFVEGLAGRLQRLDEIREVWTPQRLTRMMSTLGVDESVAEQRLKQIAVSEDGRLIGIAALLTQPGLADRAATMTQVRGVLSYCQLAESDYKLSGAPVIVAELDRLGGKDANRVYFSITILICLGVLCCTLRQLVPSVLILVETIWSFQFTLAGVRLVGGEMNFILDSLPVMVMVFTMAIAIHYLYHFASHQKDNDPVGTTLRRVAWPCFLAMFTTAIGLASLAMSEIPPVRQFGMATASGTVAAFIAGLGITPAILTRYPPVRFQSSSWSKLFRRLTAQLYVRRRRTAALVCLLMVWSSMGLIWIKAEFKPLNFFPSGSVVLQDTLFIQREMASTDSVEVVVDFGSQDVTETGKVETIRAIETELETLPNISVAVSAATFLPDPLVQGLGFNLETLRRQGQESDYIADGGHLWRISARMRSVPDVSQQQIFHEVEHLTRTLEGRYNVSLTCTGIAPLVERAQQDIFEGFWSSVITAFLLISAIMMICLRSVWAGTIAMIPNITPIVLVFGFLGWTGTPTDIGTMMTGSIALGIAVDGTFHFLTQYRRVFERTGNSVYATRIAMEQTGPPIVEATLITGLGMLGLAMSNFGPTVHFGLMMTISLALALVGDLILLPCLLFLRPRVRAAETRFTESPRAAGENSVATQSRRQGRIPAPHLGRSLSGIPQVTDGR